MAGFVLRQENKTSNIYLIHWESMQLDGTPLPRDGTRPTMPTKTLKSIARRQGCCQSRRLTSQFDDLNPHILLYYDDVIPSTLYKDYVPFIDFYGECCGSYATTIPINIGVVRGYCSTIAAGDHCQVRTE